MNPEISGLLVFWHKIIFSPNLSIVQKAELLFPEGLFMQLCCCFSFLAQGRSWGVVLRQDHLLAALKILGEEVVIAPREGSLPAQGLFLHLGFGDGDSTGLSELPSIQGILTCKAAALLIIKKITLLS